MEMTRNIVVRGLTIANDDFVDIGLKNGTVLVGCVVDLQNTIDDFTDGRGNDNFLHIELKGIFSEDYIRAKICGNKIVSIKFTETQ